MTPREVFARLVDGTSNRRWDALPDLYAEDTVVTHPMDPSGEPLVGREALRRHFAGAAAFCEELGVEMTARDIVVHETADPEVIVAEFEYAGRVAATGRTLSVRNIFVLRVRDGVIVESRDYADHARFAAAIGRLPDLIAAAGADRSAVRHPSET